MKNLIKKLIPRFLLSWYHFGLSFLGALIYGFPSKKIKVIGITGSKGKSTSVYLTAKVFQEAGYQVGWISSLSINSGNKEVLNPYHMTMPGRMFIHKTLAEMIKNNCQIAIIEVTSEGIKQFRHKFIDFNFGVLTNLARDHLEAHGGFKNYRAAKAKLFQTLSKQDKMLVNLDDLNTPYYLKQSLAQKFGYSIKNKELPGVKKIVQAEQIQISGSGVSFKVKETDFQLNLLGEFNLYNALTAISLGLLLKIDLKTASQALQKINQIQGRMEQIDQGQDFKIFIDLAHTPESFEQVFRLAEEIPHHRMIALFGAAGGGRDKWKRPELARIAGQYADQIILCNEDPYQEDAAEILNQIEQGLKNFKNYQKIQDRRQAIRKALSLAKKDDILLFLGKGTEASMVLGDKKIPWNEKEVIKEELGKILDAK